MDNPVINTISLCSGVGMLDEGFAAGLRHLGIDCRTILYAEREAYPVSVLESRMEEGSIHPAPIWCGDFTQLDGRQFRGVVDAIVAGFPCQDLSVAGNRAGLDGARSGLFFNIADFADDCEAWLLFLENVRGISSATATVVDEAEGELEERAAARVLGELADRGWNAEWITISASDVGASHGRDRWFCFAWRQTMDDARHLHDKHDRADNRKVCGNGNETCATSESLAHAQGSRSSGIAGRLCAPDGRQGQSLRQQCLDAGGALVNTEHAGLSAAEVRKSPAERNDAFAPRTGCACESARSGITTGKLAHPECGPGIELRSTDMLRGRAGKSEQIGLGSDSMADTCQQGLQGPQLGSPCNCNGGGRKHMDQLPNFVAYSPLARQTQDGRTSSESIQNLRLHLLWELIELASRQNCLVPSEVLHQALIGDIAVEMPESLQHRFQKAFQRAALSPLFASWLMGWPIGWTIAEPHASSALETVSFRSRLQSHLSCLLKDQEF